MDLFKFLLRITLIFTIPLVAATATFFYIKSHFFVAVHPDAQGQLIVEVPADATSSTIGEKLKERDLVKAPWVFSILAGLRSDGSRIKAGEYEIQKNMTPKQILETLLSGKVFKRDVEIPVGDTIWQIADIAQKAGIANKDEFLSACTDQQLLIRAGISSDSFEGYLYPGTYKFSKTESVARIIWKLLEQGEAMWQSEYTDRAEELKLSRHEILTFASLILAETSNPIEMPAIAGVYHNRLMNLMKLRSEASVRYGLKNPDRELTEEDYEDTTNPYNTFAHYGLPPGPINSPDETAIKAVLYYQEHQYLFFLKDESGGHQFAETLKDFNALKEKMKVE